MTMCVNSTTRRPARGCGIGGRQWCQTWCDHAAIVFGNPARHSVPCSVSPSSHCARRARSAIRRSKSRFVADAHAAEQISDVLGRDIPARARRMGAAAEAAEACVESRDALLPRGEHIGEPQAARVVEMSAGEALAGDGKRLREQRFDLQRIGVAHRIGEPHALGAGRQRAGDKAQHFVRLDAALDRAAERGADPDFDHAVRTAVVAQIADPRDLVDHIVGRLAQIREAVRVARRQRKQHQVRPGLDRALGALEIRHQHGDRQSRQRLRERDDLRGVGKLGQEPSAGRTSRPRSRAARRRRRRAAIRASAPSASFAPDSAGRRAGRLRGC